MPQTSGSDWNEERFPCRGQDSGIGAELKVLAESISPGFLEAHADGEDAAEALPHEPSVSLDRRGTLLGCVAF